MKNLIKKKHTETELIYKTSLTDSMVMISTVILCFIATFGLLIYQSPLFIFFGVGGLIILFKITTTLWYFNKESNIVLFKTQHLIIKRAKIKKYTLSDIETIYWRKELANNNKNKASLIKSYNYIIYIKFPDASEHAIVSMTEQPVLDMVKELYSFLQLEKTNQKELKTNEKSN